MKIAFKPKTKIEKFGNKVLNQLVENFPRSFFVGGIARDLILKRKTIDIDIATSARPQQVMNILKKSGIKYNPKHQNFGVITAKQGRLNVEITSFRTESYKNSRYPKIKFTNSIIKDSRRRDFTANSLYFKRNSGIIDYHRGIEDIKNKTIRFIGNPSSKINQDPLRIIRALRFAFDLGFNIETKSFKAIQQNFYLVQNLTKNRIKTEINKIKSEKTKIKIFKILNNENLLTKDFKNLIIS